MNILEISHEELLQVNFKLCKRYRVCECIGTSFSASLRIYASYTYCFCGAIIDLHREDFVSLGAQSAASVRRAVAVAYK
jgi:hypothetical protein